jgi:hypothetical protein
VWISNHRSVAEILDYVRRLGALVGAGERANGYADELKRGLDAIEATSATLPRRPKVYFEEWDEPRITGIRWVAELVRIAGGDDIFPERAAESLAKNRILPDDREIIARLLVRQEVPARQGRRAPGLGKRARGARRRTARDQVADHPAARPRRAHRRRARAGGAHPSLGASLTHSRALSPIWANSSVMRPACIACSLEALPCSARLATPWAMAARRKKLKASTKGQSAGMARPVSSE